MADKFQRKKLLCSTHKIIYLIIILVLLLFVGVSFGEDSFSELGFIRPKIRVEAPSFTLKDLDGISRKLQEFKGKFIFLNFWATWCHPCRDEMPEMKKLWRKFKNKDFVIIAIAVDKNIQTVSKFCKTYDITFPVLLDLEGKVRKKYEVTVLPMTYIIGKDGKITGRIIGSRKWGSDTVETFINSILKLYKK